jgi:AraC-like DNA-binding protein
MLNVAGRPLANHTLFETGDLDDARRQVADVYCDHRLDLAGDSCGLNAWQTIVPLNRIGVGAMSYGGDVYVDPGRLESFYLLMLPYVGTAQVSAGDQNVASDRRTATLLSPTDPVRMRWNADCAKIMVRIDRAALEQLLATMLGRPLKEALRFNLHMPMEGRSVAWWRFVTLLMSELECEDSRTARSATLVQLESLLLTSLLEGQQSNYSDTLRSGTCKIAPRHVRQVERFIEEHAGEAISMEQIVEASGVSGRALYDGFKQFRETSPMAYLRSVRMQRVREDLMKASYGETVSSIAARWGFFEFGRFAGQYRKLYGETPSQTLRRR